MKSQRLRRGLPGGVGESAFQAEVTAKTKVVRWEQSHQIPGTERKLLQPECDDAPRPGLQELVLGPKATGARRVLMGKGCRPIYGSSSCEKWIGVEGTG